MKEKNGILAELYEKKSQHGNTFFTGKLEGGSIPIILKRKGHQRDAYGHPIWELFIRK